jgi:hypothetical protein
MDIEKIKRKIREGHYAISFTHTEKLRRRKIGAETVEMAAASGEIIESYQDDPRGPSCLILGYGEGRRPIHIVFGNLESDRILIVTAYEPDQKEWEADWKTRKKGRQP